MPVACAIRGPGNADEAEMAEICGNPYVILAFIMEPWALLCYNLQIWKAKRR